MKSAVTAMILITTLLVVACGDETEPAARDDPTPTATASAPTMTATLAPPTAASTAVPTDCDEGRLTSGFLILGERESVPGCVEADGVTGTGSRRYELNLPPGPYNQSELAAATEFERPTLVYKLVNRETSVEALAFVVTMATKYSNPPVLRGDSAKPVAFLPGRGVIIDRTESSLAAWVDDTGLYTVEVFDGVSGLSVEDLAGLLVWLGPKVLWWNPDDGEFRDLRRSAWTYDRDERTGVPVVDAALDAWFADRSLELIADTVMAPCVVDPAPAILSEPACPDDTAAGALVPAYLITGCGEEWRAIGVENKAIFRDRNGVGWLYGVAAQNVETYPELKYVVIVTDGQRFSFIALTAKGIAGATGSCGTGDHLDYWRSVATDDWVLPPLFPIAGPP
jgi:hypothetical protein